LFIPSIVFLYHHQIHELLQSILLLDHQPITTHLLFACNVATSLLETANQFKIFNFHVHAFIHTFVLAWSKYIECKRVICSKGDKFGLIVTSAAFAAYIELNKDDTHKLHANKNPNNETFFKVVFII
jgi:hypothetical protein